MGTIEIHEPEVKDVKPVSRPGWSSPAEGRFAVGADCVATRYVF